MHVANDVTELVGETPLVRLDSFEGRILGKLESQNPASSVKDRIAVAMLERAVDEGLVDSETTIVEPTSGNTGIGLAFAAAAKGFDLLLTMPESMSKERRSLLAALGAEVVLTPAADGMDGAIRRAESIADERPNTFVPQQFSNLANPWIHRTTTGPEIWHDTDGAVDILVAGIGTGGTITGTTEFIKESAEATDFEAIGVEPAASPVLSGGEPGSHGIQGIGAGFVPEVLRSELLDDVRTVDEETAITYTGQLAAEEGIIAGISAGAAVAVASRVASERDDDPLIVTIVPDTGERYLSTDLYS